MAMASHAYTIIRQHPFIFAIILFFVTPPLFRLIRYFLPLLLSTAACFLAYILLRPYLSSSEKDAKNRGSSRLKTVSPDEAKSWHIWMRGLNDAGKSWLESKLKEESLSVYDAASREILLSLVQSSFGDLVTPKLNSRELFSVKESSLKSNRVCETKINRTSDAKKNVDSNDKEASLKKPENDAKSQRTEGKVKAVAFADTASPNTNKQVSRHSSFKEETVSNQTSSHLSSPKEESNQKSVIRHSFLKDSNDSKHVRHHSLSKEENILGKISNVKQENDQKQSNCNGSLDEERPNSSLKSSVKNEEPPKQASQNSPVAVSTNPFDNEPASVPEEKVCSKVSSVSENSQSATATPPRFALPKPPPSMQSPASKFLEASRRIFHKDESKLATPKSTSLEAGRITPSKPQETTPSKGFVLPGVRAPSRKLLEACRRLSTTKDDSKDVAKEPSANKPVADSSLNVSSSKPDAKTVGVSVRASGRRSPDTSSKNVKEDNKTLRRNSLEGSNRSTKEEGKPAESDLKVDAESDLKEECTPKIEELRKNSVRTKKDSFATKSTSMFSFK